MQEMEQETAKILSPVFNDAVWLNRAYLMLKVIISKNRVNIMKYEKIFCRSNACVYL